MQPSPIKQLRDAGRIDFGGTAANELTAAFGDTSIFEACKSDTGGMIVEFGIFNLMGARDPRTPTAQVFAEVAEQVGLADKLGYSTAWFAEHHFSNYCLCASPLMMVAHCAATTQEHQPGHGCCRDTALQSGAADRGDRVG